MQDINSGHQLWTSCGNVDMTPYMCDVISGHDQLEDEGEQVVFVDVTLCMI